ncbi:hypothetical protein CDL12_13678 [Handroanthus impetiginosus]|uniref:Uncharacterized protein n=1 Tax=Handroanthus impetiginosus TaxID=429701 RepID=A0A2G9H854_9LAMI|nr:hypothetical protein CDL12_13678 [Handroanthus impetiginosus]
MILSILNKFGKSKIDLSTTNMAVIYFTREATTTLWEIKPTYFELLGRDWMHCNQFVPTALYQLLIWGDVQVKIVSVDKNTFLTNNHITEAMFYSPHLESISIP